MCSQEQSKAYNADIQVYTIRYAMTEQLRNPPEGMPLWKTRARSESSFIQ